MKRAIMMLALFAVMCVLAGAEMWYSHQAYTDTLQYLVRTADSIEQNEDNLDNPETIQWTEKTNEIWEKRKFTLMALVNHSVIRYVDEKFVSLIEQVRSDNYVDAVVTVNVLISYIQDLRMENKPTFTNIF